VDAKKVALGERYIDTRTDIKDDKGRVLVRYQYADALGRFTWKMRKHDLEEFAGVAERHGCWDSALKDLVDAVAKSTAAKPQLLQGAA
jgi:hypothetical protein